MSDSQGFQCNVCNEFHPELPLAMGPQAPAEYFRIPTEEIEERVALSPDLCVIDQEKFFVCGNLEIPIQASDEVFSWNLWVSLPKQDFARILDSWEDENRQNEPPIAGAIANTLPTYPETQNLKALIHSRSVGLKPLIVLESADHPLSREQREGTTMQQVQLIAEQVLHPANDE